jgi:hypothetical protein
MIKSLNPVVILILVTTISVPNFLEIIFTSKKDIGSTLIILKKYLEVYLWFTIKV